ncbi:hypothetical protein KP509_05G013400 [Ceratopteris richardii]|uniref:Uncharacterized protein n=1 Tax=Ceratopteris richardii TaxID=49495 RepID=A0A8T2URU2_CERRI|nr:hypothetical protein KP509_05G013400 [Ceratopteris richardii]
MEHTGRDKWVGSVHGVIDAPLDTVWETACDACGVANWMPMVESCQPVRGEPGLPGFVRVLKGTMFPHPSGEVSWMQQKLVVMDPFNHKYTYSMEDGNIGLTGYISTLQLFDFDEESTMAQWEYQVDPVIGIKEEAVLDYLEFLYKTSFKRLEDITRQASGSHHSTAHLNPHSLLTLPGSSGNDLASPLIFDFDDEEDMQGLVHSSPS